MMRGGLDFVHWGILRVFHSIWVRSWFGARGLDLCLTFDLFSFPLLIVFYILVTSFPVTFSASFKYITLTSLRCFPLHTTIIWVILVE